MRSVKKIVLLGITLLLSLGFMFGCSNKSGETAGASNNDLTFWYMGDGDEGIKPIVDEFTEETGIDVQIQSIPWSSSRDKLLTAVASDKGPDVVQMGTSYMSEFVDAGALYDMTDEVEEEDSLAPDNFFEGSVDTANIDDKYYGVPWYAETRALYYRQDLLKDVGYSEAPKNWEELEDAAKKLSERGDNMYGFNVDKDEQTFGFMFARQNGSKLFEGEKPLFNQPEMVEALQYLNGMVKEGAAPKTDLGIDVSQSFGGDGILPMFISGPWMINEIKDSAPDIDGKWSVAQLPKGPENNISIMGGANLAVFESSKNKEDAMELIEFLAKPENQTKFFENTGSLPSNQEAWDNKIFTDDPQLSAFGEQLESSEAVPAIKEWEEIAQYYLKEWEQITSGEKKVQPAMDDLNQQAETLIDK
ncbi:sugar ABC transporter substrate-binding protein [Tetragenococcus koreensis]|uniref:sugar ABC transporter substrate-binding protein n=1 Tax=Tetragenococcus koreensis TaxID=290335 RepID=UPI001F2DC33A|nr:sugar ABC transporter substrate-binding protein [Tetragenococcus koreensis]MDN6641428.1 sugar ABC transporter substrate-binding protein [Tetragenococcus sp.]MDN6836829.1 sugar ABC transporter substrate-binding protein [Lactococcus lactis]MDN6840629.1 sugar ABC transporter substrate-binding protein [Tetragenococcus halophilus]MCF1586011.1 sugar ABC transporter substrate-binding protein [Tetragenococcus koreensis]MCF1615588.1 sugar ABC transporter substrate-binding protein [Tetragenococcus ko